MPDAPAPPAPPPPPRRFLRGLRLLGPLLRATADGWVRDNAMRLSAALALYTILSLPPLMVITAKVVGAVMRDEAYARDQLAGQITALMGPQVAAAVRPMIDAGARAEGGALATVLTAAVLLFSATGVFVELQDAMNTIWGVKPKPTLHWWDVVRARLLSLAMVFGIGFLLLVSMFVTTVLDRVTAYATAHGGGGDAGWLAFLIDSTVSLAVVTVLFAAIFRLLPDVRLAWRHVWGGAALTAGLFTAGKYALALYFRHASPGSAFGAAGSLAAVMLWVYYSAFILFFGAEFTKVWSVRHLHEPVKPDPIAVKVTEEDRARQGIPTEKRLEEAAAGEPLADGVAEPAVGRAAGGRPADDT